MTSNAATFTRPGGRSVPGSSGGDGRKVGKLAACSSFARFLYLTGPAYAAIAHSRLALIGEGTRCRNDRRRARRERDDPVIERLPKKSRLNPLSTCLHSSCCASLVLRYSPQARWLRRRLLGNGVGNTTRSEHPFRTLDRRGPSSNTPSLRISHCSTSDVSRPARCISRETIRMTRRASSSTPTSPTTSDKHVSARSGLSGA